MEKPNTRALLIAATLMLTVCTILQAVTLHMLHDAKNDIMRIPTAGGSVCNCSSGNRIDQGYIYQSLMPDPGYYDDGYIMGTAQFRLTTKIPGSQLILRYRVNQDGPWCQATMKQGEPLCYEARFRLAADAKVEYQELQVVHGEVVQASEVIPYEMRQSVGSGDVTVHYEKQLGSKDITFTFESWSNVEALQVAEIRLKVNKAKPQEFVLAGGDYASPTKCSFEDEGFTNMVITVTYKDGTVHTATYDFSVQNPVIKR
jgi:hypothetical protein